MLMMGLTSSRKGLIEADMLIVPKEARPAFLKGGKNEMPTSRSSLVESFGRRKRWMRR